MSLTLDIENNYFLEIAKQSLPYNMELYLFSPQGISPMNEIVDGFYFNKKNLEWEKEAFDIPAFIYDRTYYQSDLQSRQGKAVVQWLKNQKSIRFLGYGLPNKWTLYEKLSNSPLSSYLPKTYLVSDQNQLLNLVLKHKDIIIKPVDGAQGFAVYHLILENKEIRVRTTKKQSVIEQTFAFESFLKWINRLLNKHSFIAQKRIQNVTVQDEPFDIRVLLNKDSNGEWREFQRAIRKGESNGILTNVSRGASYFSHDDWKKNHPTYNWTYIEQELEEILEALPLLLEETFSPLFEIGVDIIIADDSSLWILDINSKPGHKIIQALGSEKLTSLYQAPLDYCEYLSSLSLSTLNRGDF